MRKIFYLLALGLLLTSCDHAASGKVIVLQPFGDFSNAEAQTVREKIAKINPKVILRPNIPFPKASYNRLRNRYRADTLIAFLKNKVGKDTVIVGL